jgi:hypothetical protein
LMPPPGVNVVILWCVFLKKTSWQNFDSKRNYLYIQNNLNIFFKLTFLLSAFKWSNGQLHHFECHRRCRIASASEQKGIGSNPARE